MAERCASSSVATAPVIVNADRAAAASRAVRAVDCVITSPSWLHILAVLSRSSLKAGAGVFVFATVVSPADLALDTAAAMGQPLPPLRAIRTAATPRSASQILSERARLWRSAGADVAHPPLAILVPGGSAAANGDALLLANVHATLASEVECMPLMVDVDGTGAIDAGLLCVFTLGAFVAHRLRCQLDDVNGFGVSPTRAESAALSDAERAMRVFSRIGAARGNDARLTTTTPVEELVVLRAAWERASSAQRRAIAASETATFDVERALLPRFSVALCAALGGAELTLRATTAKTKKKRRKAAGRGKKSYTGGRRAIQRTTRDAAPRVEDILARLRQRVADEHGEALLHAAELDEAKSTREAQKREQKRQRRREQKQRQTVLLAAACRAACASASTAAAAALRALRCAHCSAAAVVLTAQFLARARRARVAVHVAIAEAVACGAAETAIAAAKDWAVVDPALVVVAAELLPLAAVRGDGRDDVGDEVPVAARRPRTLTDVHRSRTRRPGKADATPSLFLVGLSCPAFVRQLRGGLGRTSVDLARLRLCSRSLRAWSRLDGIAEWSTEALPRLNAAATESVTSAASTSDCEVSSLLVPAESATAASAAPAAQQTSVPLLCLGKHRVDAQLIAQLSDDIIDMSGVIDLMAKEQRPFKMSVVNAVRVAISSLWPHSRIEVFGSFAVGLGVPGSEYLFRSLYE